MMKVALELFATVFAVIALVMIYRSSSGGGS